MSTKLFKNTEGKVLMSVGNKLIKQPYEFGLAFQNRMGLNNYIEISGLSIETGWTVMGICDTAGVYGDFGLLQLAPSTMTSADNIVVQAGRSLVALIDNIGLISISTSDTNKKVFFLQLTNNSGCDNGNSIAYLTNNINTTTRTNLRIGASGYYTGNLVNPTQYLHPAMKINKLIILDRTITLAEYRYFRNNLLFSDLQTYEGVRHMYDISLAEVINISGVDQPAIRDSIGGVHGIITRLPAGTAQQKVDYANANLFVPF